MGARMAAGVVCALSLAAAVLAQSGLRAVANDPWCKDQGDWDGDRARSCLVYEGSWPAGGSIALDARPNGGIQVRGVAGNEVRLRARVVAMAGDEAEARELASQVRVRTGGSIGAEGPERTGRGAWWSVSYRLEVPVSTALDLQTTNGGIHVSDIDGKVALLTTNGGLHLSGMAGDVSGRTTNGGVHVTLDGTSWRGAGLDLATTNGGVHLSVPRGYNARLETGTVNGRVHADVTGAQIEAEEGEDRRHGRRHGPRRIVVDLGQGGPTVRVKTTNGSVHLNRQ